MIKQIPNLITSLNLVCGTVAILLATTGDLISAAFFIFLGIFFDFFDGLAARLLNARSAVGKELDSLADVVTSGVAPAVVMLQMMSLSVQGEGIRLFSENTETMGWVVAKYSYFPFLALLIAVAAAYRLAKFNVDTRQTDSFTGLPTPANALLIVSLPLILHFQFSDVAESIILNKWFLLGITILSCVLMNSKIRLFALKFKGLGLKQNGTRYLFLAMSIVALIVLKFMAIPLIILIYILLSLIWKD